MQSGALSLFLQDLKQKFQLAKPDVTGAVREQLLFHQFVTDLPASVSKQLRAAGDVARIEIVLERVRLLMVQEREHTENHLSIVAATSALPEQHKQV